MLTLSNSIYKVFSKTFIRKQTMTNTPKILAFAGSTREASYNKKLVKIAAEGASAAGAEVTYVDLRDLPMPAI
jgi:hypothetical protein